MRLGLLGGDGSNPRPLVGRLSPTSSFRPLKRRQRYAASANRPANFINNMKTTEVQAAFAALLDAFKPISGQPTDEDLTRLRRAALSALVPIPYDKEKGKHLLLGLLLTDDEYHARYGTAFPVKASKRPAIYDESIAVDATADVRAKAEAIHQAKLEDWKFFNCAQREVRNFIVHCVDDTWIRELRDAITGYAHVPPRDIMVHLWKTCSGLHSIDVLALRTKMLTMHEDAQGKDINGVEPTAGFP